MKIGSLSPYHSILKELGSRLSRVRKQQGFSQDRLAEEAGIGVATLRRIEDGQDSQLSSWLKLLKTLQMTHSIDALLPEDYSSPMAEVMEQRKHYRAKKRGSKQPADLDSFWEDEKT